MVNRILSAGLEKPYCYDPSTTFFSFCQNRWISLPLAPDHEDIVSEYINELVAEENGPVLRELQERITRALADADAHGADAPVEGPEAE